MYSIKSFQSLRLRLLVVVVVTYSNLGQYFTSILKTFVRNLLPNNESVLRAFNVAQALSTPDEPTFRGVLYLVSLAVNADPCVCLRSDALESYSRISVIN